jgi:hypothetical protein
MREPTEGIRTLPGTRRVRGGTDMAMGTPMRAARVGRLEASARQPMPHSSPTNLSGSLGSASTLPPVSVTSFIPVTLGARTSRALVVDPDVWLIALPQPNGGLRSLEGAGRAGAIRVSRPYGHLRSIRPVLPTPLFFGSSEAEPCVSGSLGSASTTSTALPAERPLPQVVGAVEVETDAGLFRVERLDGVLGHTDMGWALAHLDPGEPDSQVPISRRQLALLLTLLPTPEDPHHPEHDSRWGWAHRLRGPWERGPLHVRGRLGRLIAFDPDDSGKGMHRACFELLGTEEIVWALGVPCFRTGSVYELVPIGKGLHPSRWLTWPLVKGRKRSGTSEPPTWEIARIVYRIGAPRWPLAGVVEPLGPLGVAG